jgi:molecular chaperone GrpE
MAEDKEKQPNLTNSDGQDPAENEILEGEVVDVGQDNYDDASEAAGERQYVAVEDYDALSQELEKAQEQARGYFEGWQRERADFANYKRRIERDQQSLSQNITADIVKRYLAVQDDMERALKARPTDGTAAEWSKGIELIARKLQSILEADGVRRIEADGSDFDPNIHEAISYEESPDHDSGQVIEVIQQGYMLGDRVIRPALVRVAR